MNELMEKVDKLKNELDSSTMVLSLKDILDRIKNDKELSSLLERYSIYPDEKVKQQILDNDTFQEFKIKETELNLFIMDMNQRLKVISKKGSCHHESN